MAKLIIPMLSWYIYRRRNLDFVSSFVVKKRKIPLVFTAAQQQTTENETIFTLQLTIPLAADPVTGFKNGPNIFRLLEHCLETHSGLRPPGHSDDVHPRFHVDLTVQCKFI